MNNTKSLNDILSEFLPILEKQVQQINTYPIKIALKYGLETGGISDEDNNKAMQEWKDIYHRLIFLIKEINNETCMSPLAKLYNDAIAKTQAINYKIDLIKDRDSLEYRKLMEECRIADDECIVASILLQRYQNKYKDELFDLLKTWWWDLLSY